MFTEPRTEPQFNWAWMGNFQEGRPNMGMNMDVRVYRLMQFTLRDILIKEVGVQKTDEIFYKSGEMAGRALFQNVITQKTDLDAFVKELQKVLKALQIGILRVEKADVANLDFTLTVAEDLDCSGLPISDEEICVYDEGFIAGLLSEFTHGEKFKVKEVDCWCSGDRVCRFDVKHIQ